MVTRDGSLECINQQTEKNEQCSPMQYYKYQIMPQTGETFNVIHRMGRLFQQYIVDMYAKIELERLNYIRNHQTQL